MTKAAINHSVEQNPILHYYPFGSVMQTRSYSSGAYRFGFSGKEKEVDGTTDNYDFGARIYDGRLGRWMTVDPLLGNYLSSSSFSFCYNAPIICIDPNGKEVVIEYKKKEKDKEVTMEVKYDNGKYYKQNKKGNWKQIKSKKELEKIKTNEFVKQVVSDIEKLRSLGGETQARLETLEKSPRKQLIRQTSKVNETYQQNDADVQIHNNNVKAPIGSTILYKVSDVSSTNETRPSFIGLGHELLGHAYLFDKGAHFDFVPTHMIEVELTEDAKVKSGGTNTTSISIAEINTISFDNIMRNAYNTQQIASNNLLPEKERKKEDEITLKMRSTHSNGIITKEVFDEAKRREKELMDAK